MKVKIIETPSYKKAAVTKAQAGNQVGYGLDTGAMANTPQAGTTNATENQDVRTSYPEADRKVANIEVEKGEHVLSPDLATVYKANGKKHYDGGTPIQAPEGAYIVSDFIKTDPAILDALSLEDNGKKKTWSKFLGSKVDPKFYNGLSAILKDDEAGKPVDPYELKTAQINLPELQKFVSKVALGNELAKAKRGKQFSIPGVAAPAMQSMQTPAPTEDSAPMFKAKYGGFIPRKQYGGANTITDFFDSQVNPSTGNITPSSYNNKAADPLPQTGITAYTGDNNFQGNASAYNTGQWNALAQKLGFTGGSNADFQRFLYSNPTLKPLIDNLHQQYGAPNGGNMFDGKLGHRWDAVFNYVNGIPLANDRSLIGQRPVTNVPGKQPFVYDYPSPPPTSAGNTRTTGSGNTQIDYSNNDNRSSITPNGFDLMAVADAMGTPVHTYYPWEAKGDVQYIHPQFDDPNYYPIQAAQRQRMDSINQNSNPSIARAVGSYQPDQIQGIMSETQRTRGNNMQAAMNAQMANAQTYNQKSMQDASIDTDVYNKTIMSREQRDIARKLKTEDIRSTGQNMINNMMNMAYMQAFSPQYKVSGPFWNKINFTNGKTIADPSSGGNGEMTREQFLQMNPGYASLANDPQNAYKIDDAMRMEQYRRMALMSRSSKNYSANMFNPFVSSMMGMGYPPGMEY